MKPETPHDQDDSKFVGEESRIEDKETTLDRLRYPTIQLDHDGLPLIPQPTTSPYDPLNYPNWLKYTALALVSMLAFLATLNVAIINPAVVPLSTEFSISHVVGTYQTTIAIGTASVGPLVSTPLANVYGRRPVYLISILIGFASAAGSASAKSYGTLIVARTINGLGPSAAMALGAGTVTDLFFVHQRGKAMGIFTLMSTSGGHLAPIVGGYVARDLGWRWCFWTGAILNGAFFIVCLFLMPETLFDRPRDNAQTILPNTHSSPPLSPSSSPVREGVQQPYQPPPFTLKTYLNRLWFWDLERPPTRRLKATDFVIKPLSMLKYPSVAFPALYYAVTYGFASIEPALTLATIFTDLYGFDTVRNGLANGVSLLLGAALGEVFSGPVTDMMMQRARRRIEEEEVPAEVRLQGIWTGAITVPLGLLIYGVTVHYRTTFIAPCIGMAIACFGIQIVSSVSYSYSCGDCYRERSNDVSLCFNFFRQGFGLTLGFYSIPFGEKVGYQWSFTVFLLICVVTFLPIVALMFYGEKWRKKLGQPEVY
ncbi:MFS general substrate transporter [Dendrothele bispora CBS 962.96]|uniref:MFS general substrate transporter n=1 Tax=Dendrothele bispora (strain CBS 962.96) TaxID=1314807 RepID=A0A4S8MUI1_DENBC|nr:MFS general substrate transporter [Dendrothele bispora CBS 962.96]